MGGRDTAPIKLMGGNEDAPECGEWSCDGSWETRTASSSISSPVSMYRFLSELGTGLMVEGTDSVLRISGALT